ALLPGLDLLLEGEVAALDPDHLLALAGLGLDEPGEPGREYCDLGLDLERLRARLALLLAARLEARLELAPRLLGARDFRAALALLARELEQPLARRLGARRRRVALGFGRRELGLEPGERPVRLLDPAPRVRERRLGLG